MINEIPGKKEGGGAAEGEQSTVRMSSGGGAADVRYTYTRALLSLVELEVNAIASGELL